MKDFYRYCCPSTLLAASLIFGAAARADLANDPSTPNNGRDYISADLNRDMTDESGMVDVFNTLKIVPKSNEGRKVEYVSVTASAPKEASTQLLVNDKAVGKEVALDGTSRTYYISPGEASAIGARIDRLSLRFNGGRGNRIRIGNVGVRFSPILFPFIGYNHNYYSNYPVFHYEGCRYDWDCGWNEDCFSGACYYRGSYGAYNQCYFDSDCGYNSDCWNGRCVYRGFGGYGCRHSGSLCGRNGNGLCCSGVCVVVPGDNNNYCR